MCCWYVQLISLYSGNRLPRDLIVQLCDEADNPTPEENIRIQLSRDAAAVKVNITLIHDFSRAMFFNQGSTEPKGSASGIQGFHGTTLCKKLNCV